MNSQIPEKPVFECAESKFDNSLFSNLFILFFLDFLTLYHIIYAMLLSIVFTQKEVKEKNQMLKELQKFMTSIRPAFSRQATFNWFVIVCVGFILRNDFFGVSSIIRALNLAESCYPLLLNFFHSSAWSVNSLMHYWQLSVAEDKNKGNRSRDFELRWHL